MFVCVCVCVCKSRCTQGSRERVLACTKEREREMSKQGVAHRRTFGYKAEQNWASLKGNCHHN